MNAGVSFACLLQAGNDIVKGFKAFVLDRFLQKIQQIEMVINMGITHHLPVLVGDEFNT
jgi:hypothetical protein